MHSRPSVAEPNCARALNISSITTSDICYSFLHSTSIRPFLGHCQSIRHLRKRSHERSMDTAWMPQAISANDRLQHVSIYGRNEKSTYEFGILDVPESVFQSWRHIVRLVRPVLQLHDLFIRSTERQSLFLNSWALIVVVLDIDYTVSVANSFSRNLYSCQASTLCTKALTQTQPISFYLSLLHIFATALARVHNFLPTHWISHEVDDSL